jgi:hypothetical protein
MLLRGTGYTHNPDHSSLLTLTASVNVDGGAIDAPNCVIWVWKLGIIARHQHVLAHRAHRTTSQSPKDGGYAVDKAEA